MPGTRIDRYARDTSLDDSGNFLSPAGTDWTSRALPYDQSMMQHATYEVLRPFDVNAGQAASWFDEAGAAVQYMTDQSVGDLIRGGLIRQIP